MASRRLPSSLAARLRTCNLFRQGQRCSNCDCKFGEICPLKDIEDIVSPACKGDGKRSYTSAGLRPLQSKVVRAKRVSEGEQGGQKLSTSACLSLMNESCAENSYVPAIAVEIEDHGMDVESVPGTTGPAAVGAEDRVVEGVANGAAAVPLSSKRGEMMFCDALAAGTLESYFKLVEQMSLQEGNENATSSLSVVLNALAHDCQQVWKDPWRWNTVDTLKNFLYEKIEGNASDLSLTQLSALARSCGARAHVFPAVSSAASMSQWSRVPIYNSALSAFDHFRARLKANVGDSKSKSFIIVNFRSDHVSSSREMRYGIIGGFSESEDAVLILDVRRASSPYWLRLDRLWQGMSSSSQGACGGYMMVSTWVHEEAEDKNAPLCPMFLRSWSESSLPRREEGRTRSRRILLRCSRFSCGSLGGAMAARGSIRQHVLPSPLLAASAKRIWDSLRGIGREEEVGA